MPFWSNVMIYPESASGSELSRRLAVQLTRDDGYFVKCLETMFAMIAGSQR